MKRLAQVLIFLASTTGALSEAPPKSLTPVLDQFATAPAVTYVIKVSEIPPSVINAAKTVMGPGEFAMADRGKAWNATDYMEDPGLPLRRLIWATEVKNHFILHYELGGRGHSMHFIVVSPEDDSGQRKVEWVAAWSKMEKAADLKAFVAEARAGNLVSDARMAH